MKQLIEWSQGNPGALNFLMGLMRDENLKHSIPIVILLEKATTIRGTNLWVLYSDLCGKDYAKVAQLCKDCPQAIIEDACSRQDYSGRELVASYLKPKDKSMCQFSS